MIDIQNHTTGKLNDQPTNNSHDNDAAHDLPSPQERGIKGEGEGTVQTLLAQPSTSRACSENVKLQTSNFEPSRRRLTGKVAALPRETRDLVNSMLDDGHSYEDIVAKLAELGHPGFSTQNISRWKLNGYERYLRRQERADDLKLRHESLLDLVHQFGVQTPAQLQIANCHLPITNAPPTNASDSAICHLQSAIDQANAPERVHTPTNASSTQLPITNFQLPITNSPTPTNANPLTDHASRITFALESLLSLQLFDALLETTHSDLPLETKAKLLHQVGRLVISTTRERTRRDAQLLNTRKYDDARADLLDPPPLRKKRDPNAGLSQEALDELSNLLEYDFQRPPRANSAERVHTPTNAFTPDAPVAPQLPSEGGSRTSPPHSAPSDSASSIPALHPVHPVHLVHSVPSPNSAERARTPSNSSPQLQITNCQLPITNSPENIFSLPNPNAVGEWPQPPGTIPVLNVLGCIVGWAAHPEIPHAPDLTLRDPAANKAEPIQSNQKTVLWYDRNSQVRNCPTRYPIRGRKHFVPVIDSQGFVIDWREWDGEWLENPPPQNPRPLLTDRWRGQIFAWLHERPCAS